MRQKTILSIIYPTKVLLLITFFFRIVTQNNYNNLFPTLNQNIFNYESKYLYYEMHF